tara:strand:- start:530 stop:1273 length:744 start_codon:yes stop_codon:yes gene_type:complete
MDKGDIRTYTETYKLKLDASQSLGYVKADPSSASNVAGDGEAGNAQETSSMASLNMQGQVFFDLPALNTKSTQCLMRIKAVTIPASQYTLRTVNLIEISAGPSVKAVESTFSLSQGNRPIFYVTASNVLNRSYMSYGNGIVGLKDILGSINITSNLITNPTTFDAKEAFKVHKENNFTNIIDDSWVLCSNPFGSRLHLNLINSVGEYPIIKSSSDGLPGVVTLGSLGNFLIDSSLVYELEVKLIEQL